MTLTAAACDAMPGQITWGKAQIQMAKAKIQMAEHAGEPWDLGKLGAESGKQQREKVT